MTDRSRQDALPAYRRKILDQSGSTQPSDASIAELFFHLGYWPDPAEAGRKLADLKTAQQCLNDRLTAMADLRDGLRVLDVGCGIGGTLADIARKHTRMELIGLNIDSDQLRRARASVSTGPDNRQYWIEADGCRLPFIDGAFDRVLAVECIFHFPSRREFFAQAARVLTTGGLLALSDFVVTDKLRTLRSDDPQTARLVEDTVVPAVGPWPDFWGEDSDDVALASERGLTLIASENASAGTQPSYRCFVEHAAVEHPSDARGDDPVERAMAVMEWLQVNGYIEMVFYAFERRPPV